MIGDNRQRACGILDYIVEAIEKYLLAGITEGRKANKNAMRHLNSIRGEERKQPERNFSARVGGF